MIRQRLSFLFICSYFVLDEHTLYMHASAFQPLVVNTIHTIHRGISTMTINLSLFYKVSIILHIRLKHLYIKL